jgi:ketosteroid isomerase-like protein
LTPGVLPYKLTVPLDLKEKLRMLRSCLLMGCLTLAALATGCSSDTSAADAKSINDKDIALSKNMAAKDTSKFADFYAPDANLMLPNEPLMKGFENVKAAVGATMGIPGYSLSWQVERVEASSNLAYSRGAYNQTSIGRDGKPTSDHGNYVTVWKKQPDGSWKAIEQIFTSDQGAA